MTVWTLFYYLQCCGNLIIRISPMVDFSSNQNFVKLCKYRCFLKDKETYMLKTLQRYSKFGIICNDWVLYSSMVSGILLSFQFKELSS